MSNDAMNQNQPRFHYTLTYFENGRKVGQMVSSDLSAIERDRAEWDQESDTHTSTLDTRCVQDKEGIDDITADSYLVQSRMPE